MVCNFTSPPASGMAERIFWAFSSAVVLSAILARPRTSFSCTGLRIETVPADRESIASSIALGLGRSSAAAILASVLARGLGSSAAFSPATSGIIPVSTSPLAFAARSFLTSRATCCRSLSARTASAFLLACNCFANASLSA